MKWLTAVSLITCIFFSCGKEDPGVPASKLSDTPAIELILVSPLSIHQLEDSLYFVIEYVDGNGDLGDVDADTLSLWITDNRFPLTEKFHIPPLSPSGSSDAITGILNITLDHIILEDPASSSEPATFSIRLKDRAGNWSNTVETPTVTILP